MTLSSSDRKAIVDYRLQRAYQTLDEARYVVDGRYWNLAANRLYYAAFYACTALLLSNQLAASSHVGVSRMMSLHFVKPGILSENEGKLLKRLFRMRQTGDYDDLSDWDEDDIVPLLPQAETLLRRLSALIAEQGE